MFVLAHLSDPHLPPPPARLRALKQVLSRRAWRRKKADQHRPEVLAAIVADLQATAVDHVAVTGDLTNFSAPEEIGAALRWLEALGPARDVTVTPGNHDRLVRDSGPGTEPWAAYTGDFSASGGAEPFPRVRVRDGVALVNADSAVPTNPVLATGRLGPAQLERLEAALAELGAQGLTRVLLLHHPVAAGAASRRKALEDRAALAAVLRRVGAELVLHGHLHAALLGSVAGPRGPVPVLGAPSASMRPGLHADAARWRRLAFADDAWVAVEERGVVAGGGVERLGQYRLRLG